MKQFIFTASGAEILHKKKNNELDFSQHAYFVISPSCDVIEMESTED